MLKWTIWLLYQLVTTALFYVWYARKHPAEAREMFRKWRRFFLR